MNSEEQTLIDGLFTRLQQAQREAAPRDAQAQTLINEHIARQPSAPYFMTQAILVQEAAIKQLDQQNKQLQAELEQARAAAAPAPAATGGSFLSSMFGGGNRAPAPAPAQPFNTAPSSGGWRDGPSAPAPAPAYAAPQAAAPAAAGSGFLGGALKTAAGVAGGVMLAQGISSLFSHHQQPQVVEEIIEEPTPTSNNGWGNDNQQFASNDRSGIEDVGYDDDNSFFSDDDSFV
ncbi:DUF2076 domain-containing protein [Pseudomonas sp. NPDC096917]|uniref:DUF2076 domain-containing protein n=1 Tax=Pseudomonas sp. NPDC096917 TaxID=3364483 RepID=UPI00383B27F8